MFLKPILFITLCSLPAWSQFSSGSDGSDGALNLTEVGDFFFSAAAFDPPLDQDGDGIFHFTTINIAAGVTVYFSTNSGPVFWLATGTVQINGTLNLNGQDGHFSSPVFKSRPGPGGFGGGLGNDGINPAEPGNGPGRGLPSQTGTPSKGGGAGHAGNGRDSSPGTGGLAYGNPYLLPLIGGSGGAGGGFGTSSGDGGGAGGGAILIASSLEIVVDGTITANGGNGGDSGIREGGGGSGGSIRLVAPTVNGFGSLTARGGTSTASEGAMGRIRIEGGTFLGTIDGSSTYGPPGLLFLATDQLPVRIVRIAGVDVPALPQGGYAPPDVTVSSAGPTAVHIEARGVPLGTVINLTLIPQDGDPVTATTTPLAGTLDASTATATVEIPFGFSRFFLQADW